MSAHGCTSSCNPAVVGLFLSLAGQPFHSACRHTRRSRRFRVGEKQPAGQVFVRLCYNLLSSLPRFSYKYKPDRLYRASGQYVEATIRPLEVPLSRRWASFSSSGFCLLLIFLNTGCRIYCDPPRSALSPFRWRTSGSITEAINRQTLVRPLHKKRNQSHRIPPTFSISWR